MKKSLLILFVLMFSLLCYPAMAQDDPLTVIATNFPSYDFARTIAGETAEVRMLLPPGSESHSYEPSPKDIIAIQNADLFICTGGESDTWIEAILTSMGDQAPVVFRLSDCVTLLEEEYTESMEHHHEHEEDCEDPAHHHHAEMDEHVWTSPKNVMVIVSQLCSRLSLLRPDMEAVFRANLETYLDDLSALDKQFEQIVTDGKRRLIVFGDRFPLRYFAAAYQLEYDAAFPGCSEDSEPSVRTIISLVDQVRQEQIPVVFYIEFSSRRTADILAEETGAVPMMFHSCHNISHEELEAGATYLSLMQQNALALKEALN